MEQQQGYNGQHYGMQQRTGNNFVGLNNGPMMSSMSTQQQNMGPNVMPGTANNFQSNGFNKMTNMQVRVIITLEKGLVFIRFFLSVVLGSLWIFTRWYERTFVQGSTRSLPQCYPAYDTKEAAAAAAADEQLWSIQQHVRASARRLHEARIRATTAIVSRHAEHGQLQQPSSNAVAERSHEWSPCPTQHEHELHKCRPCPAAATDLRDIRDERQSIILPITAVHDDPTERSSTAADDPAGSATTSVPSTTAATTPATARRNGIPAQSHTWKSYTAADTGRQLASFCQSQ